MIPKRPKEPDNVDAWLMSYADMITLLLCFFVIFVSVSEPKRDKITEIADGMVGKFGAVTHTSPFTGAVKTLQGMIEEKRIYKDMVVEGTNTSISIEMATQRFFKEGGAQIDESTLPILQQTIDTLKSNDLIKYTVIIESYTDDTQPKSGLYPNNWELSAVRAAKLAQYFVQQGIPENRIKAVGYGSSRPKVPNIDAKGNPIPANRARNQRISIQIE